MICILHSVWTIGLEPQLITIEVTKSKGIPGIVVVGLSAKQAEAIKHKVIHLVQYLGFRLPSARFVVNIAPGDIQKSSTQFELPVLVGVLHILGAIKELPNNTAWIGELSLEGKPNLNSGVVRLALAASKLGFSQLVLPMNVTPQLEPFRSVLATTVTGITTVSELLTRTLEPTTTTTQHNAPVIQPDESHRQELLQLWNSIKGQSQAKRALRVAAAGRHHILLLGPPGVGKTALARCAPLFVPPLVPEQQLTCTVLHQEAGLSTDQPMLHPPFRRPHHSVSVAALLGGGSPPKPGELNLAHHGVLFLDELGEWPTHLLESLRQPLEDAQTRVAKGKYRVIFPAESLVIAASNPCPCGYFGSELKKCRCTPIERARYRQKFSGPLLDRFDLIVWLSDNSTQVESVIETPPAVYDRTTTSCSLTLAAESLLLTSQHRFGLSHRVVNKIRSVSQTIALLEHTHLKKTVKEVTEQHVFEALSFRPQLTFLEN